MHKAKHQPTLCLVSIGGRGVPLTILQATKSITQEGVVFGILRDTLDDVLHLHSTERHNTQYRHMIKKYSTHTSKGGS